MWEFFVFEWVGRRNVFVCVCWGRRRRGGGGRWLTPFKISWPLPEANHLLSTSSKEKACLTCGLSEAQTHCWWATEIKWIRVTHDHSITEAAALRCSQRVLHLFSGTGVYSEIPILRPPLGLSKTGLKDYLWTVPKVVSNQSYTGCRKWRKELLKLCK